MGLKRHSTTMPKKPTKTPRQKPAKNPLKIPQPKIPLGQKSFVKAKIFYDYFNKKPAKNP
jgi:hypothetical protein